MIKAATDRRKLEGMIRLGEYFCWRQPDVAELLIADPLPFRVVNGIKISYVTFDDWKRLMEEPPRPGRSGGA